MDTAAVKIEDVREFSVRDKLSAYVELTKPRIAFLLVLTSAAGFYLATKGSFDTVLFINAMIGITLLAFGVATLNQWVERDIDPLMERTEKRPLPSKRVSPNEALFFGIVQCAVAEAYLLFLVNGLTAVLGLVVIVGYVLVYTPLKTRTSASTAIGAIPGALPPLMGWTAAANEITVAAWALFAMQFLWQFPHFFAIAWMYREQYKNAGILMLPVVEPTGTLTFRQIVLFTIMLVPVSIAPFIFGISGIFFLVGAILLGLWFLYAGVRSALDRSNERARKLLLVSVIYLPLLFILMVANKL
ncbi:MAG: heme o synthase [Pyrinomonadaceae bacterium]|nr:protoheme IX farnesyltransferase [Acidobacteriota bacterium]MBP7416489.1 heme o synthase [Pyrinomonadaceae bacterium]